jgi:hypothetical protein
MEDVEYGYIYYNEGDVFFHQKNDNKLILGYDMQYFYSDRVGFGAPPTLDNTYLVQMHTDMLFQKSHVLFQDRIYNDTLESKVRCGPSNITLSIGPNNTNNDFNMRLDTLGVLENKLIISDTVKINGDVLKDVYLKTFNQITGSNLYTMSLDNQYANKFTESNMFVVGDVKFVVKHKEVNFNQDMTLIVLSYLPEQMNIQDFPLSSDRTVNIQMLKNINPQTIPETPELLSTTPIVQSAVLTSYEGNKLYVTVDDNNSQAFQIGGYYTIKTAYTEEIVKETPTNILILVDKEKLPGEYTNDVSKMSLTFKTPDDIRDDLFYLNPIFSYFENSSSVTIFLFPLDIYRSSGKAFSDCFTDIFVTESEIGSTDFNVTLKFTSENRHMFEYLLNVNTIRNYVSDYAYILDDAAESSRIWSIERFDMLGENEGSLNLIGLVIEGSEPLIRQQRNVKLLLFRPCIYNRIGDGIYTNFMPFDTKFSIGTTGTSELLTVGGDMSCKESLYLYGKNKDAFAMHSLTGDGATLGSYASMCNAELNVHKPTTFENPVKFQKDLEVTSAFMGKSVYADILYGNQLLLSLGNRNFLADSCSPIIPNLSYEIPADMMGKDIIPGRYLGKPPHTFSKIKSLTYVPAQRALLELEEPGLDILGGDVVLYVTKDDNVKQEKKVELTQGIVQQKDDIRLKITLVKPPNSEFLLIGRMYALDSMPHYPFLLTEMTEESYSTYHLTLKTVDNKKLMHDVPTTAVVIPLDTIYQPRYNQYPELPNAPANYPYEKTVEKDLYVGFKVTMDSVEIVLRGAKILEEFCYPEFFQSFVNKIYLSIGAYEIEGLRREEDRVFLRTKFVRADYMKAYINATAAYAFNGLPAKVVDTQFIGDNSWIPTFEFKNVVIAHMMSTYSQGYMYIMDFLSTVWYVHALYVHDNSRVTMVLSPVYTPVFTTDETRLHLSRQRHVFIVPFKHFIESPFKDASLSVRTNFTREAVTINGPVSYENTCRIYDSQYSAKPFEMKYENDVLRMNDSMTLSSSNIHLSVPSVHVDGNIYANKFMNTSDERLKTGIVDVECGGKEEELLGGLQLKEYDLNGSRQRGFMAQDVQKIFPQFVQEVVGVVPWNTGKYARKFEGTLYFEDGSTIPAPSNLVLESNPIHAFDKVKILGVRDKHLVVDQNSLLMTAIWQKLCVR